MTDRYFVPICLYPHTAYRTHDGVEYLFEKYELQQHDYMIVIADRLLALDRLVTGRYWSVDTVYVKAKQEAGQIHNLIAKVSHRAEAHERGSIAYWDEIVSHWRFEEFSIRMRDEVLADQLLRTALDEFVSRRVSRFGLGSNLQREREFEREYLLGEVCMSVFCTEVLGYCIEVWERPPAPDLPDPLKLLYDSRPEVVARATGHPPRRVLRFLYDERGRK
jgi:hypothetical protein